MTNEKTNPMPYRAADAAAGAAEAAGPDMAAPVITPDDVARGTELLRRYKDGKRALEARIIADEQWYRLRHWQYLRDRRREQGGDVVEPTSAWLFNAIVSKHADAMDSFPEAVILPRSEQDEPDAKALSAIVPAVLEKTHFEQVWSDAWWYKLKHGCAAYGVFWDSAGSGGLGGAAEHSFEPGIVTIHYNPDPVYGWTFDTDGTWQGYKVSGKGACLHTGYGTTENTVPATCGADGHIDTVCANCGDVIATEIIPATGAHTWDNGTVTTEPTETTPGVRTFTCAVCSQTKTEVIPATGTHTFVFTKNIAPTCTEAGYDLYTCRDCGATEKRNVKPALGHKWDSGTVTVAPTETTPGVRTYTCTVCGQTRTEIIPATGSAVCPGGAACPSFRFRDVPAPSNWAHEGIDYCVRHGLMSGFDATTFSPDTVSTRAQIVMILYNLSGDTTDYSKYYVPFTDVRPGTWYYNAVAWGYDKDIVSGMSTTTFAPDGLITREQMAVLLYGYTEKYAPAYLGGAASLNGFPDAASVSNWAYAAMSWAVGNGLISGIASNGADYLAPSGGATRAQIAAIMMRYCRLTGL